MQYMCILTSLSMCAPAERDTHTGTHASSVPSLQAHIDFSSFFLNAKTIVFYLCVMCSAGATVHQHGNLAASLVSADVLPLSLLLLSLLSPNEVFSFIYYL